jgi:hypothetical protein
MITMPTERDGAAIVIAQDGERVQVEHRGERLAAAMKGFPEGFRLNPGTRVILVDEPEGPVAMPLVRVIVSRLPPVAVQESILLDVEGRRLEMQVSTLLGALKRREAASPSDDFVFWILERNDSQQVDQVMAIDRRPH